MLARALHDLRRRARAIRTLELAVIGDAERDPPFAAALAAAGLAAGVVLDHGAYEQIKRRLADLGRERGYADARFAANRIDVYPEEHAADIALNFDSGARYAFGRTELTQDVLTEQLASSFLTFNEGEPYDARQLVDVYATLADSGYFRTIDVRPLPADPATRTIPIGVTLTSAPRVQTSYGVGYSTDTQLRLRFGRNNRRFNDRGHQFGINAQLSPVMSEVRANYRLPINSSRSEWLNLDVGVERENTDSAESEIFEIGARRVRERRSEWTRTQMLALRVEDFEIADQASRARCSCPASAGRASAPTTRFARTSARGCRSRCAAHRRDRFRHDVRANDCTGQVDLVLAPRPAHPRPRPGRRHGRARVRRAAGIGALLRGR